jgi:hypothetical protein
MIKEHGYTNKKYWDCLCESNYIHSKNVRWCLKCGADRDEQPDSIQSEVEKYLNENNNN